jgi:hypothetical protein
MFESGVLGIFGRKRDEITEKLRRPHKEELYGLHFLPYVIRVIKSRRMIWAGYVMRMRDSSSSYRVWWGDLGVDGRIMLKLICKKRVGRRAVSGAG